MRSNSTFTSLCMAVTDTSSFPPLPSSCFIFVASDHFSWHGIGIGHCSALHLVRKPLVCYDGHANRGFLV